MADDSKPLLIRIGARIRQRRMELGLTQDDLAGRIEMSRGNVAQVELGMRNVTVRTICRFAASLDITPDELFTGRPPPSKGNPDEP